MMRSNPTTNARIAFTLFALAFSSVIAASIATAQPGGRLQVDPEERVERTLAAIRQNVGISVEQAEQLRPIFLEDGERRSELFEQFGRGNREAMRAAMDVLGAETNELVSEVLSEDQMTKYLTWQESRPRRPRGRGNRPQGGG